MPFKPMQVSYRANPRHVEAYSTLFSGTGKINYNTGNDISREDFPQGYAIYAFDLTVDMRGVSLVCYGEFANLFQIDLARNVAYDYSG